MNIKKAEKLSSHIGIQSPKSATILCFDDSIPYSDENVKRFSEISSQSDGLRMQESSLTDQIDAVLNHTDNRYNNSIRLCDTPEIFVQIGLSHLPMLYAKKHLRDALKPKNPKKPHQHGLTVSQIKNIPEWLAAPAIIFDSISPNANGRNSIVTVLNAVDQDNAPLLVTIMPNGQGVYQLESIPANYITSIYGKENNFATYIERAATAGNILFWDKNKSQDLFSVLELQLPQGLKNLDSNIIRKSTAIVNSNLQIFDPKKPITSERRATMLAAFAAKHNLEDLNVFVKKDKSYQSDGRAYDLIVKDGKSEVFSTLLFTLEPGEIFTESVLQSGLESLEASQELQDFLASRAAQPSLFDQAEPQKVDTSVNAESKSTKADDLAVGNVILYDGARRKVASISEKSISLKNLDAPDFGGILTGTSDVLAYDGWQEDMERKGFEVLSKSEPVPEASKPITDDKLHAQKQGTMDSYLYQVVTDKARFIAQLLDDETPARISEDCDDKVLTYGEMQAAAEGNDNFRKRIELGMKVSELQFAKAEFQRETGEMRKTVAAIPEQVAALRDRIDSIKCDIETVNRMRNPEGKIEDLTVTTATGNTLTKQEDINLYLQGLLIQKSNAPFNEVPCFKINGFQVTVELVGLQQGVAFAVQGESPVAYRTAAEIHDKSNNAQRLLNLLNNGIANEKTKCENRIEKLNTDLIQATERLAVAFPHAPIPDLIDKKECDKIERKRRVRNERTKT